MDLAEKIDPAEVLSHLKQLGYRNITPVQLKEFIRDLKKLIVYDQLSSSSSSGSLTSLSSSVSSDSEYYSSNDSSSKNLSTLKNAQDNQRGSQKSPLEYRKGETCRHFEKGALKPLTASVHSGCTLKRSSTTSSLTVKSFQKENALTHRGRTASISDDNLQEAMKPKTSFIRPWQLQGNQSGAGRTGPNDPVTLYHYYQSVWSKHKCPGEDSRADLRWLIREKMIGQDPHLYSRNQVACKRNTHIRM